MISFSPDGTTKYTADHSFQNKASWYLYGTAPTYGYLADTWQPVMHLGKNSLNNLNECVLPSSLVSHVRSKYPSASSLPVSPSFQFAKTTCVKPTGSSYAVQGFATFIPGETDPFDTGINGYSSHLLTGCHTDVDGTSYAYIQPTGYTGNSSVLINQTSSDMVSEYYSSARANYINQYEYPTDSISSFDKITKLCQKGTYAPYRWYHVAVNFCISIQALNYDFHLANRNTPSYYGVQIPVYIYRFNESSANPSWSFTWDDVHANDRSKWTYVSNPGVFRLTESYGGTGMTFARAWPNGSSGYLPQGKYYIETHKNYDTNICYTWISGHVNFETDLGNSSGGCPRGNSGISIGSPIVVFKNSTDYLMNSASGRGQLLVACAENFEIWT